jgi:hypothetical protein
MNEPNVARSADAQNGRRVTTCEATEPRAELETLDQLFVAG